MKYIPYSAERFRGSAYYRELPHEEKQTFDVLTYLFPFKTNQYVLENLIHWDAVPEDPIYRIVFPRREAISDEDFGMLLQYLRSGADKEAMRQMVQFVRKKYRPQVKHAKTSLVTQNDQRLTGLYHQFQTKIHLFPSPMGRTCHAYCNYCFRWNLFGEKEPQENMVYHDPEAPVGYLTSHPEISDVLFTGADPMVLSAPVLKKYIAPILTVPSVKSISISTKSLAWWPYRFTHSEDLAQLLALFSYVRSKGVHLSVCAHFTHPKELEMDIVRQAAENITSTGASIYTQGPLVNGVNDHPDVWAEMWDQQVACGMVPNYMFMEADIWSEKHYRVPLAQSLSIFQEAKRKATSLAHTVRGPVFMNDLVQVQINGVIETKGQKSFALQCLQAPPTMEVEGQMRWIPFDPDTKSAGDLVTLFSPQEEELQEPLN
ncbi:MAG TPA: lysine 2,3-aminomutase [Cytophagales bacterium]|nr:lysine 2,3-aminomutase [Cytophagales bacterium]HAP64365.1 lysine 2,3-aminomutase [Cytophagales bacterium]